MTTLRKDYLLTAVLLLMTAFVSCKKDPVSGSSSSNDDASIINATVVNGDDYNGYIATVKAMTGYEDDDDWYEYELVSGKYANGGFKLTLPATVSDKYLWDITDAFEFDDFQGTISDPKAKIVGMWTEAYDKNDEDIGEFYCEKYYDSDNWMEYVYVDRNVTIKGYDDEYGDEYDCSFTKGWNIMYIIIATNYEWTYTTTKPSGINYKWYFYDESDWKKSPSDKGKHQHSFFKMQLNSLSK